MSEFSQKVGALRSELDSLSRSLTTVGEKVLNVSAEFEALEGASKSVDQATKAVGRLHAALNKSESTALENMQAQVANLAKEINNLNPARIRDVNSAFVDQEAAVSSLKTRVEALNKDIATFNSRMRTSVVIASELQNAGLAHTMESIAGSMGRIDSLGNFRANLGSLQAINTQNLVTAAQGIKALRTELVALSKTAEINVKIKINDDAVSLRSLRERVRKNQPAGVDQGVGGPKTQASILNNSIEGISSFSDSVYRPISYGVTEFGAFMNGILETLRGIRNGTMRGLVDALGGIFKSLHSLNNGAAYFGLGGLPFGIGQLFNRKRSTTITDFLRSVVNLKEPDQSEIFQRRARELTSQESVQERRVGAIRSTLKNLGDNPDPLDVKALRQELADAQEQLKLIRQKINAYNKVAADYSARFDETRDPLSSRGATLSNDLKKHRDTPVNEEERLHEAVQRQVSIDVAAETQAEEKKKERRKKKNVPGKVPDLPSGIVIDQNITAVTREIVDETIKASTEEAAKKVRKKAKKAAEAAPANIDQIKPDDEEPIKDQAKALVATTQYAYQKYIADARGKIAEILQKAEFIDADEMARRLPKLNVNSDLRGLSPRDIGGYNTVGTGIPVINVDAASKGRDVRTAAFHESIHTLTEPSIGSDSAEFLDPRLEAARKRSVASAQWRAMASYGEFTDTRAKDVVAHSENNLDYIGSAGELLAHAGEAVLTGNKQMETAIVKIYGTDLFKVLLKHLSDLDPDSFLQPYKDRFQKDATSLSVGEGIASKASPALDAFKTQARNISTTLQPVYDGISKNIRAFVSTLDSKLSQYTGKDIDISRFIKDLYNKVSNYVKELLKSAEPTTAQSNAAIFVTSQPDPVTGVQRTYSTPDSQPDFLTQVITKYGSQIDIALRSFLAATDDSTKTLHDLFDDSTTSGVAKVLANLAGIDTRVITKAIGFNSIPNLTPALIDAVNPESVDNTIGYFRNLLGNKLGIPGVAPDPNAKQYENVNLSRNLEKFFKDTFNLRPYSGKEFVDRAKNLDAPVVGLFTRPFLGKIVSQIADSFNQEDPNVTTKNVNKGKYYRKLLIKGLIDQLVPKDINFEDELNEEVRSRTGRNIRQGSYSQIATYDPVTGLNKFTVSAQTADGAIISLNANVDAFGRKKIVDPAEEMNLLGNRFKRFLTDVPNQLIQQATYSITNGIQQMVTNIISVQDELSEVANLYQVIGEKAESVKTAFLEGSVRTAVATGQGFQEAIATNLKNFKLLGAVRDPNQREDLSNQLSVIQLGAQTAFGISLEQSLESIPAILSDIQTNFADIDDPVKRTTASIAELQNVMDQIVVAQRATGASGDELLTVYARLAASAREYGLTSKDLIALTAVGSVSIGKGEAETSNILRSFLEGTYSTANESQLLKDYGIATRSINKDTGKIQNREFTEVLNDILAFTQNPETSGQTAQLLQVFAGPKVAGDIGKFVRGYGADFNRTQSEIADPTTPGTFNELVTNKIDNYQGSLNKLNASATELFNTFLIGTGVLGKLTNFLEKLSQAASLVSGVMRGNQGLFSAIVNIATPNIIDAMVSGMLGAINVFTPFVKLVGSGQRVVRSLFAELVGFDKAAKPADRVQKSLGAVVRILKEVEAASNKTTGALTNGLDRAATHAQATQLSISNGISQNSVKTAALPNAIDGANTAKANKRAVTVAREAVENISSAYEENRPRTAGNAILRPELSRKLGIVGDAVGSVAAPLAFDLLAGGLRTDNIAVNAGAAIAGAFVGAATANPAWGVLAYSIVGEILDKLDAAKWFHISDREADAFADAFGRRIRKAVQAETPEDLQVETDEDREKQRKARAADIAREFGPKLDSVFGIDTLRKATSETNRRSSGLLGTEVNTSSVNASSTDLERYMRLIIRNQEPASLLDKLFLNTDAKDRAANLYDALGNNEARQLYTKSNLSTPDKFIEIFDQLAVGKGPLLERKDIQDALITLGLRGDVGDGGIQVQSGATAGDASAIVFQSSEDIIKSLNEASEALASSAQRSREVPYGLDVYSPFGPKQQALQAQFAPKFDAIAAGKYSQQESQEIFNQFDKAKAALDALPSSLQVLIPLAEALGLATTGLEDKLYKIGPEGQSQIVQKFQPALESINFNRQYEQKQKNLAFIKTTDQYTSKDPAIMKEVEALNKALTSDKARYDINRAYLEVLKGQTNALLEQTDQIEKQQKTRQLISAGTPAQFTPASIFDTKGLSASQINAAIEFALRKQQKLQQLNPAYAKEFAKDQFLLQSGTDYKGVQGVNQGFVQEYLQQQQAQAQAPLEDLSQYSDEQIQGILTQARALQKQAEALDPARAGKYDNERLLILKKNNQVLSEVGIGQEFLRAALQANTKSNDTLRGHYNLPSSYRSPTVWDYYDRGGKTTGDVNFPTQMGNGMVPLELAKQLAQEMVNGTNAGTKGADLAAITNTVQPGARPLFYPTPGTAPVYSDPLPDVAPDESVLGDMIKERQKRIAEHYYDLKMRQIDRMEEKQFPAPRAEFTDIEDIRARRYGKTWTSGGGPGMQTSEGTKTLSTAITAVLTPLMGTSAGLGTSIASLITGAATFTSLINDLKAKIASLDFVQALQRSNISMTVNINGQAIPVSSSQIQFSNSGSSGGSSLRAGPSAGSRRQ